MKKLTKTEKRVLIAKDVLELLAQEKIHEARGSYMSLNAYDNIFFNKEDSLEKSLKNLQYSCQVCALGSLLYAHVNRFNEVKTGAVMHGPWFGPDQKETMDPLLSYFSKSQLALIENYFEGYDYEKGNYLTFRVSIETIMKNIIKNKGSFKPNKSLKKEEAASYR